MIHEIKAFSAACDNCGEGFSTHHEGWSIFVDKDQINEMLDNEDWYNDDGDPDHEDKTYCPQCFKRHPEEDDKIIVDESRKILQTDKEESNNFSSEEIKAIEEMADKTCDLVKTERKLIKEAQLLINKYSSIAPRKDIEFTKSKCQKWLNEYKELEKNF